MTEWKVGDRFTAPYLDGSAEIVEVRPGGSPGYRIKFSDGSGGRFKGDDPEWLRVPAESIKPIAATPSVIETILQEAQRIVDGPRREHYGEPKANHGRTAALWSAFLGVPISMRQVCVLNILQKISRDAHSPQRDNLTDIAGYARNAELVT